MQQLGITSSAKTGDKAKPAGSKMSAAAAALAAAKAATSSQSLGMVSVTETRRFAGKNITMTKQVAAGSKEASAAAPDAQDNGGSDSRNKQGLDAVLASLAQAKKVGVLDKSRADWRDFKSTNDATAEELEVHKRSGEAFLDRQAFLGRAELREYEKERDARLGSDVRNRGRL
jgi:Bucentaur or craniofacial development